MTRTRFAVKNEFCSTIVCSPRGNYLLVFVQLSSHVQYVLVRSQRHRERVTFDDTVQREFLHFQRIVDVDQRTHAGNDVGYYGRGLRVDNGFAATWQPVHLSLRVATGRNGGHFLDTGHVLPATVSQRFAQVLQAYVSGTWIKIKSL